jgi:hypothetical protein
VVNDRYGIKKIYPDSINNPLSWYITGTKDPRMEIEGNLKDLEKMGDEFYFEDGNDLGILNIFTNSLYKKDLVDKDHGRAIAKGFMMSPRDFRDVEITIYVNVDANIDDRIAFLTRGGKHYGTANCEGFAYRSDVYYSGKVRHVKEQFHERMFFTDFVSATSSLLGKWTGIKFIVYNSFNPVRNTDLTTEKKGVVLETLIDANASNNWQTVFKYSDFGGWGNSGDHCGGDKDQIGLWASPVVSVKWFNASSFLFKWFSVREINPYGVWNEGGSNSLEAHLHGGKGYSGSASRGTVTRSGMPLMSVSGRRNKNDG